MSDVAEHLRAGFAGSSLSEALRLSTSALLGVSGDAAAALERVGVTSIFDLGSSWLFDNAADVIAAASREPGASSTQMLDVLPAGQADDPGSLPLENLRGMSDDDAQEIKQALAIDTIREFALWPPRRVAQGLLAESGEVASSSEEEAEVLRPRLGEFPTERVYYNSLVMLGMAGNETQTALTGTISLQPAVNAPAGFGHPAVGALVTLSQSWYAKGITLGHMLHSLALAPGEATRIAVVDFSRRTRATVAETIEEAEALDTASEHSRAISEVQNAVASEMQEGGSMSSGWAKSTSSGSSGGFSVGGGIAGAFKGVTGVLGFGGGSASSSQSSETNTEASSSSWSIGNRSVMAEMAQHVNDRTEQHSTSVRNRRASAVREVSQSEHEEVSTRVVANYNHMHALTVQYYEVVQVYRVLSQVHSVQRVLFLPFELLDFAAANAMEVVARFRAQLVAGALTQRVASLLIDERGEIAIRSAIRVQLPSLFSDVVAGGALANTALAGTAASTATSTATTAPTPAATTPVPVGPVRRITTPGPVLDVVPGDLELVAASFSDIRVDRVRFDQAGVPAETSTFAVPNSTFQVDFPGGLPLRNISAVHVTKADNDADTGTMTLHFRSAGQPLTVAVPLELVAGTAMQKVAFLSADPANRREELLQHLQSNRAYYSQAVLRNLDSATLVMLLSRFSFKGKPLADQVEPKPLTVAGNYLVLRAPVEDQDPAGLDDAALTWSELLQERALTSEQRNERLVPIPTGGVFAEAVLGRSNSAEKLDITRFWNWQDSPIPLQPPEIAPVVTGGRGVTDDLRAGQLGAPVLNISNPVALPDAAGLGASLNTLAAANLFRDMSGLAGTQALAQAGSAGTLSAATEAGRIASANLKTVTDQAVAMGQTAADMWKTSQLNKSGGGGGSSGGGKGGSGSNVSTDGARINHGRDMDQRGVTDSAAGGGAPKVTESRAIFGAAGSGDSGGGVTNAPISRELAFADTAATGVSPALLSSTTGALNAGTGTSSLVGSLLGGPAQALGSVGSAMLQFFILGVIRADVEKSGRPLTGVTLRPMDAHVHGEKFRKIGLFAWTNSATEIFVDTDLLLNLIKGEVSNGRTADEATSMARAFATYGVRHEVVHIDQFKQSGRPGDFKTMVKFERAAYGCTSPRLATSDLAWLGQSGAGGAEHYFVNSLGLSAADATTMVDGFVDSTRALASPNPTKPSNCNVLDDLDNLTDPNPVKLEQMILDGLIAREFLPKELVAGQPNKYKIADLYK